MSNTENLVSDIEELGKKLSVVRAEIAKRFIGQAQVVDQVLATLLSGGHGILVGLPGLGKTRLVETVSTVLGMNSNRVQFTPDLMPADILGSEILDVAQDGSREFRFLDGPIFCQLLMADEINRASPRTQSALLQAMQEKVVSIAGETRQLPTPFNVLATQNPIEQEGTYPLPEAQLDRFMMEIVVPYPDRDTEADIVMATTGVEDAQVAEVFTPEELAKAQNLVRRLPVGENIAEMVLDVVRSLRPGTPETSDRVNEMVSWGPGPRAAQALMLGIRAHAVLKGNLAPSVEDVMALAVPVLRHRMALNYAARADGLTVETFIGDVLQNSASLRSAA